MLGVELGVRYVKRALAGELVWGVIRLMSDAGRRAFVLRGQASFLAPVLELSRRVECLRILAQLWLGVGRGEGGKGGRA